MATFKSIVKKSQTVAIPLGDDTLNVTYDPTKMTPAQIQKATEVDGEQDPLVMARYFCTLVSGWDLYGPFGEDDDYVGEDELVPLEVRYVRHITGYILNDIVAAVMEDVNPKSQKSRKK